MSSDRPSLLLVGTVVSILGVPASAPAQEDRASTVDTRVGTVRIIDAKEARPLVKAMLAATLPKRRGKKPAPMLIGAVVTDEQVASITALARVQHASIPAALRRVLFETKEETLRVRAAEALLAQEGKKALPVALDALGERELRKSGPVTAMLVRCASAHDAPAKSWAKIYGMFIDLEPDAQNEMLDHVANTKDWNAIELLLQNVDAPAPKDVKAANNPPASYWKRRWEKWRAFGPKLQSALRALLGKGFDSEKEARAYIESKGGIDALRKLSDPESSGSRR
ncbi:MAG: hypothetical protein KDC95_13575 [Planctomycetes bacterium]|nr:hypothetical protein [Planctomycetota bacterium]